MYRCPVDAGQPNAEQPNAEQPDTPPPYDPYDHGGRRRPAGSSPVGFVDAAAGRGRSRAVAVALALLLGGLGIHKFYLGRVWQGILYLLFFWTAIPAIVSWIEAVLLLNMEDATFARRYGGTGRPANRTALGCLWILALAPVVLTALYLLLGGEPGGLLTNPLTV